MPATQLFATTSAEELWQDVARPWLHERAAMAWREARATVVLTPQRAEGFYLRGRLLAENIPLLGVHFWTPSDARKFLLAHYLPEIGIVTQAGLRLLARLCAERLASQESDASTSSVAREPAAFLRAYDLLVSAGWNPSHDGVIYGRTLTREWQRELQRCNLDTQAGLHRRLWRAAASAPQRLLPHLLVTGFNAAHWPLWDLLKATVLSAEQTVVALTQPRIFGEAVDQLWHGSWEEFTKTEALVPETTTGLPEAPFAHLAASYESGAREHIKVPDLTFCVTPDLATQTRAIVLHACDFLRRDDCTRLGLVFPEANALALNVAAELRRLGLALNDGPGFLTPGLFERRSWLTWLELQEEPGVPELIAWLRACGAEGVSFASKPGASAETFARVLESALGETLVDDLAFLSRHLEGRPDRDDAHDVAAFLRERVALPEEATFAQFHELTLSALALRGWEDLRAEFETEPPAWLRKNKDVISRRAYLAWLREAMASQERTRGPDSNHFYGKVHLLVYGQLGGQTWSHLILTGLNEGVWPRVFEVGAFGSRHELDELNQQARTLNRRARSAGAQGAGQELVGEGHGHCLLPLERQELALRDLCAALEATTSAVCLAAISTEAGRSLLPSDFFTHAYATDFGLTLDEDTFARMAGATEAWCLKHNNLFEAQRTGADDSITTLRTVHAARRDASQPFGPYEFAYDQPPGQPIQLWCKAWESAWLHPASAWLESVVGAAAWPEGELSWPRAIGTWVHRWLAQALRHYREQRGGSLAAFVDEVAVREAQHVRDRATAVPVPLYPWWGQVWAQARAIARGLAVNLEPQLQGRDYEVEFRLPKPIYCALPGAQLADFELKGRPDLLLFPAGSGFDAAANNFGGTPCWVVDFKTGSTKALTARDVPTGRGLQALLYALAVRALGAGATKISLLTPNAALKEQVDLDAARQSAPLFRSLDIMHRAGIFGMRPDADNAYGFSPAYPLATRIIPREVLETKWALVHGDDAGAGGDDA